MYVVMICGGIGSGKSVATEHLAKRGAISLSLDSLSHELLVDSEPMRNEIVSEFGEVICDDDGSIVPARLAEAAFFSPENAERLNEITFPYLIDRASDFILSYPDRAQGNDAVMVVEVPLLEKVPELRKLADEVIVVVADEETRIDRVTEKTGDREDVVSRVALQASDAERMKIADTVIENNGSLDEFVRELDRWWEYRKTGGWER